MMKKLKDSFKYALQGIQYALRTQRNLKIHFTIGILVIILAWYLKFSAVECYFNPDHKHGYYRGNGQYGNRKTIDLSHR